MRDRKTTLKGVPHFSELKLPYFTELPSSQAAQENN